LEYWTWKPVGLRICSIELHCSCSIVGEHRAQHTYVLFPVRASPEPLHRVVLYSPKHVSTAATSTNP
jgi:hypothetical protein